MTTFKKIFLSALCVATLTHPAAQDTLSTQISELCSSAFTSITNNPWTTGLSLGALGLAALVYRCYTPYELLEEDLQDPEYPDFMRRSFKSLKQLNAFQKNNTSIFYAFWNRQPIDINTGKLLTDSIQINLHLAMYEKNLKCQKNSKEFFESVEKLTQERVKKETELKTKAKKDYPSKQGEFHVFCFTYGKLFTKESKAVYLDHVATLETEKEATSFVAKLTDRDYRLRSTKKELKDGYFFLHYYKGEKPSCPAIEVPNSPKKETTAQKETPKKGFWGRLTEPQKSKLTMANLKKLGNNFDDLTKDLILLNAKMSATKLYPSKKGHYHMFGLCDGATDKQGNTVIDAHHIITYTTKAEATRFATNVVKNNNGCQFVSDEKQKEAGHYFFYFKKGQRVSYPLQYNPTEPMVAV